MVDEAYNFLSISIHQQSTQSSPNDKFLIVNDLTNWVDNLL